MVAKLLPAFITTLTNNRSSILIRGSIAIGVFLAIYIISKFIVSKVKSRIEANSLQNDTYTKKMSKLSGNIVRVFLLIFNILAIFQIIGFDTALIMGGISLSLGFAMETTIENMVAGVMFITNKKIKIGDFVQFLGSVNMLGTVEEINLRYTVIRSFDKRRTIIPNSIMAQTPIKTYKIEPLIRGELSFDLPRHVDIAQVQNILNQTINLHKYVLYKEYTNTIITGFNTKGINFKSFFFSNPQKKSPFIVGRELRPQIFEALKKYGIRIALKHMTLTSEG